MTNYLGKPKPGSAPIYLLRHGDSRPDGVKRYVGRTDHPLNATGRTQTERWRTELSGIPFRRFFCSTLIRSDETARIIRGDSGVSVTALPDLCEISMGQWDGVPMEEIRRSFPEEYRRRGADPAGHAPPGGESFIDLRGRVVPFFTRLLRDEEGPILVVGHAGVNRVILCHLLGMPLDNIFRLGQDYGCMNIIARETGTCRVEVVNFRPWFGFPVDRDPLLK